MTEVSVGPAPVLQDDDDEISLLALGSLLLRWRRTILAGCRLFSESRSGKSGTGRLFEGLTNAGGWAIRRLHYRERRSRGGPSA